MSKPIPNTALTRDSISLDGTEVFRTPMRGMSTFLNRKPDHDPLSLVAMYNRRKMKEALGITFHVFLVGQDYP